MTSTMTADEFFDSLTGFDEIAISQAFGAEVTDLAKLRPLAFQRALVFVDLRRGNDDRARVTDAEAKSTALGMSIKDATAYFAEDPAEPMPDEPVTEVGKDDSPLASAPSPLLSGAS